MTSAYADSRKYAAAPGGYQGGGMVVQRRSAGLRHHATHDLLLAGTAFVAGAVLGAGFGIAFARWW